MKSFTLNIKKMFRVLSVIQRSSKPYLFLTVLKTILTSALPFLAIVFTNRIIDQLIAKVAVEAILETVFWLILINLLVGLVVRLIQFQLDFYSIQLSYNLDNLIASKTFELDYAQIESNDVLRMIQKAEEGSNSHGGIVNYGAFVIQSLLTSILSVVYSLVLLSKLFVRSSGTSQTFLGKFVSHPASASIIFVVLLGVCVINVMIMNKINHRNYQAMMDNIDLNRKFGYFYQLCSDYRHGKDIRIFQMQPMIIQTMTSDKYSVNSVWREFSIYSIKAQTLMNFAGKFLAFLAYAYVGLKAIYGLITIGNVVAYVSAITLLSSQLNSFVSTYSNMSLRNNYLDNYFEFLNLKTNLKFGDQTLPKEELEIEFRDVSFAYPNQEELILKNVNLTIRKGQRLAIVGENGAGKTTLIKLLCRMYEPTKGEILINKIPMSSLTQEACYELFSIVFQDFALFSYSVKENVASGFDGDEERIWDALEKTGMKERVQAMDKKLDTVIYQRNRESGVEISGGEAQKLAIARALYKDSPIVILDEPTAALDPKSEAEVYENFQKLVENKTSIFISHRMSSCKFCDEIVVFDEGRIVQKGSHKDLLLDQEGLYHQMWTAQAKYYT